MGSITQHPHPQLSAGQAMLNLWRRQDSNLRPLGYEPNELPTAPLRDLEMQRYYIFGREQNNSQKGGRDYCEVAGHSI
jgi:hypothetical protein